MLTIDSVEIIVRVMNNPLRFAYLVWCAVENDRAVDNGAA